MTDSETHSRPITSEHFARRLAELGVIVTPDNVERITITAQPGEALRIRVDQFGDDRLAQAVADAQPVTPEAIAAAHAADYAGRAPHGYWFRVPDAQVARLIQGALPLLGQQEVQAMSAALPEAVTQRIQELEKLAADILDSFTRTDAGYRARVGQVQIARWRDQLGGS